MIKNYVEQVVEEMSSDILKKWTDICKCERCLNDIKCITLNNLKPLYYDSEIGGVYLKLKSFHLQYKSDVVREMTKAIEIVSQNKNHSM